MCHCAGYLLLETYRGKKLPGELLIFSLFFSLFFTLLIKRTSTSEGFLCRFGGRSTDPTALSAAAAPWAHGEPCSGLLGLSQGDALSLSPLAAPAGSVLGSFHGQSQAVISARLFCLCLFSVGLLAVCAPSWCCQTTTKLTAPAWPSTRGAPRRPQQPGEL